MIGKATLILVFAIVFYFELRLCITDLSSFQLSVESYPGFHWFCLITLCDWSKNLAPLSQPIRCKTKTNHDLVTHVFTRLRPVTCICLSSHWLLVLLTFVLVGRYDYFGFGFTT